LSQKDTLLVIGGAGYIGSVNVAYLIDHGYNVIVVDNLEKGHREALHPDATFEQCDIRDAEAVKNLFNRHTVDAVMHFGAYAYVGESMTMAEEYFTNNFIGGYNVLNAMKEHGVQRIVFSSTCAVYGDVKQAPIDESLRTEPINPYGRSKLAFELLLKSYEESYGIKHAILRYFNAAGATETLGEDHKPESHLIPLVLQVALGQREDIAIFGNDYDTPDGSCIRDYIHVSDLASAHQLALEYIHKESIFCNLGSESGYSVKEVIEAARKITGHPIPTREESRRPGDPPRLMATSKKAKDLLGWKVQFTEIEPIIQSAWNWHKAHPNGYEQ
jgi:UDP-glucose 4-epimerase